MVQFAYYKKALSQRRHYGNVLYGHDLDRGSHVSVLSPLGGGRTARSTLMTMLVIEVLIIAGVIVYAAGHAWKEHKPTVFLKPFLFCAAAAWNG